jgi:hypothetical protein
VTLSPFEFDKSSCDAPPHLIDQATAAAGRGAFLGFTAADATDRVHHAASASSLTVGS